MSEAEVDAELEAEENAAADTDPDLEADDGVDAKADAEENAEENAEADTEPAADGDTEIETEDGIKMEPHMMHYVDEDGTLIALDGNDPSQIHYVQDDGTLVAAQPAVIVQPDAISESDNDLHSAEYVVGDGESGIMQMETADGEVQLVRATGDGTYELISEEEAALFLQNQAHTIEILEDNSDVQVRNIKI